MVLFADDEEAMCRSLRMLQEFHSTVWAFSVPVPQPKHKEIVEDDFSSIDINEFLQF